MMQVNWWLNAWADMEFELIKLDIMLHDAWKAMDAWTV